MARIALQYDQDLKKPCTYSRGRTVASALTALAKCGNGHISSLSGHHIDNDGLVTPSLVCPHEGCTWHEVVKLEDWSITT